ncbi:Zn-ribbon domain-containing OB-fold protein [Corynebacterium sp. S7]
MELKPFSEGGVDNRYFEFLKKGLFRIPLCGRCGKYHFYPRIICPECGSMELTWAEPTGRGTVYSTTTVRKESGDYNVALVDLDEGPRLMSRVNNIEPDLVFIGQKVQAAIDSDGESPLLVFFAAPQSFDGVQNG